MGENAVASRELPELLELLKTHLRLLADYAKKAFDDRNSDYIGEVAAKLRLLVSDEGSNTPLLLKLMDAFGIHETLTLAGPGPTRIVTLREFVKMHAVANRLPDGQMAEFTKVEIAKTFSEKNGGAHVDWTVPEKFGHLLQMGASLGGAHIIVWEVRTVAYAVLDVGNRFLAKLTPEKVRQATIKRIRKRSCQEPAQFNEKGVLLCNLGDLTGGITCFREAVKRDAASMIYRANLGLTLRRAGRLPESADIYCRLVEENPGNVSGRLQYAVALGELKDFVGAKEQFDRVLEITPDDADTIRDRGVCLVQLGDLSGGAEAFDASIAIKPDNPAAYYSLAAVRSLQGMLPECVAALERVKALGGWKQLTPIGDPDFANVCSHPEFGKRVEELFASPPRDNLSS